MCACAHVCVNARVLQSPAVCLCVCLCSRVFSHTSQGQSHRRPGPFFISRSGSLLLSVPESGHPRGQGFSVILYFHPKPHALCVSVEGCCPQKELPLCWGHCLLPAAPFLPSMGGHAHGRPSTFHRLWVGPGLAPGAPRGELPAPFSEKHFATKTPETCSILIAAKLSSLCN